MKKVLGIMSLLWWLAMPHSLIAENISHHGKSVVIDMRAEGCLSCHDGSMAESVTYCTVQCDFSTSHVIFKKYPPSRKPREFAPLTVVLAKGIRLQNGRITCVSCHDLRNQTAFHLVAGKNQENICMACHIRK